MYLAAGLVANSVGFVTFDQATGILRLDVNALALLIGTPGAVAGGLTSVALAWWRWAQREGRAT